MLKLPVRHRLFASQRRDRISETHDGLNLVSFELPAASQL
jgi:hypothetical protein